MNQVIHLFFLINVHGIHPPKTSKNASFLIKCSISNETLESFEIVLLSILKS